MPIIASGKGPWNITEEVYLPIGQSAIINRDDNNGGKLISIAFAGPAPETTLKDGEQYKAHGGLSQRETNEFMKMWNNAVEVPGKDGMVIHATEADAKNWVESRDEATINEIITAAEVVADNAKKHADELKEMYAEGVGKNAYKPQPSQAKKPAALSNPPRLQPPSH